MVDSNNAINNTVGASISGVTNTLIVTNASDTASSAARATITVGGSSAANPSLNFNVAGAKDFEMGIDNADSDKLKISEGTVLGTNDTWIMNTAGERTMPLQPSFYATDTVGTGNATGDGTVFSIIFETVVTNVGSHYDNTTGIFTAPVDGLYLFAASIILDAVAFAHVTGVMTFDSSGGPSIQPFVWNPGVFRAQAGDLSINGSHLVPMDATDTMKVTIQISGGTKVITVGGASTSQFSGTLVS